MANIIKDGDRIIAVEPSIQQIRAASHKSLNIIKKAKCELVGRLSIKALYPGEDEWTDFGVVSEAIITASAIADLINVFQAGSASNVQNYKFHGSGTGTTAESSSQTTLVAEVETRETGTQTSTGAGNYRTVAAHTYTTDGLAITEHGLFSASSAGVMLDRSKFSPILVSSLTIITFTYDLTVIGA